jgi:type II secretory pathway pseudopilin PulG
MVVLLISMSIAAVMMTVVMPVWKQSLQREKEAELIFRGQQYVRAIGLFQKRTGPGVLPPNIDVLVTNHFLRKKFKDPITGLDFDLLSPVQQAAAPGGQPAGAGGQQGRGATQPPPATTGTVVSGTGQATAGGRGVATGIMGVASKSKDPSIRIYNGRTHYNEWQFIYVAQTQAPGAGAGGRGGTPAGRGQPPSGGGPTLPGGGVGGGGAGAGGSRSGGPGGGRGVTPPAPQGGGRGAQGATPAPTTPGSPASPFLPRR